jgi:uncharacterized protein (DUF1330 family)
LASRFDSGSSNRNTFAAAQRHPLLLAAGELARLARHEFAQPEDAGGVIDGRPDLGFGDLLVAQAEGQVVVDGHVLVERIVLEHHGDVAVLGRQVVDDPVADADLAAADVFQAGDHAQRGRFAAARRPHQDDEFLVVDGQVDVLDGVMHAAVVLVEFAQYDLAHGVSPAVRCMKSNESRLAVSTRGASGAVPAGPHAGRAGRISRAISAWPPHAPAARPRPAPPGCLRACRLRP